MVTGPSIRFGPRVDRYLNIQGAIAQAIDRHTVLVSSHVLRMNPLHQRLILLHELAHLEQLARLGNDPVRALEDEAWEAAQAWMHGSCYRIRGRARGPLNAVAIILAGPHGLPMAPHWYRLNPVEPIGGQSTLTVKDSVIAEKLTIESIFDKIMAEGNTEVIIVCHGTDMGLSIPILNASKPEDLVHIDTITFLSLDKPSQQVVAGTTLNMPVKSDKDVADIAKTTAPQVAALRKKMNDVRSMKLKHVAFRACNMGNSETLETYRALFGAASVSAPTEFDTYGTFAMGTVANLDNWVGQQQKKGFAVWIEAGVAFGTTEHGMDLNYKIVCAAENRKAYMPWIKRHLSDQMDPNAIIFHGMKIKDKNLPDKTAQSVYFVRDPGYVSRLTVSP